MIRWYISRLVFVIPESSIEEGLPVELGCKVEVVSCLISDMEEIWLSVEAMRSGSAVIGWIEDGGWRW